MEAARPRRRRRRPGHRGAGTAVDARLVRVGFVVVLPALAALLLAVSAPGTLPRSPLEPLFDGRAATVLADTLSTQYPSRVPGTTEAEEAAVWYRETVSSLGIETTDDTWTEDLPELGTVTLTNVVSVIPGRSDDTIVLVAHRDNAGPDHPLGDNATGTAALVELARSFAPQEAGPDPQPQHTLVFVSTDGGAYGGAGAERFAEASPLAQAAVAAVVVDRPGGRGRPRIALAGDDATSASRVLVRTALARLREEVAVPPELPSLATQVLDLGLPFAADEQGRLLGHHLAAVTLTTPGAATVSASDSQVATGRLEAMGEAAEALVDSLDASAGGALRTPDGLFFGDRAVSGWAVRLTLILLVVPITLAVVDLLVRCRRRRVALASAFRSIRTRLLIWAFAGALLALAAVVGVLPTGASLPLPAYTSAVADPPTGALVAMAAGFVLVWLAGRRRIVPRRPASPDERLAGLAAALALLCGVAVVLAIAKPYALVFVLPSLYAWPWLRVERIAWHGIALFLAGLAGPVVGLAVLAHQVGISVVPSGLVYAAALVTVGYVPIGSALVTICWMAAAAQVAALAFSRYAPYAGGTQPPPAGPVRRGGRRLVEALSRG